MWKLRTGGCRHLNGFLKEVHLAGAQVEEPVPWQPDLVGILVTQCHDLHRVLEMTEGQPRVGPPELHLEIHCNCHVDSVDGGDAHERDPRREAQWGAAQGSRRREVTPIRRALPHHTAVVFVTAITAVLAQVAAVPVVNTVARTAHEMVIRAGGEAEQEEAPLVNPAKQAPHLPRPGAERILFQIGGRVRGQRSVVGRFQLPLRGLAVPQYQQIVIPTKQWPSAVITFYAESSFMLVFEAQPAKVKEVRGAQLTGATLFQATFGVPPSTVREERRTILNGAAIGKWRHKIMVADNISGVEIGPDAFAFRIRDSQPQLPGRAAAGGREGHEGSSKAPVFFT